jgi:hypothetical protein
MLSLLKLGYVTLCHMSCHVGLECAGLGWVVLG